MRRSGVRLGFTLLAVLLVSSSFFVSGTAQAAAPPQPSFSDYCRAAKNKAVIPACLDAATQFDAGNISLARTLMLQVTNAAPKEGSLRMLLGLVLLRGDNAPGAERELKQARKDGAPEQAVLPPLFRSMIARHEEDQLLLEFPEPAAGATGEVAAQILHGRAQALKSLGRIDEAVAAMDKSIALRRVPVALRDRAGLALAQNDTALAGKLLDEALTLDPGDGPVLIAKLRLLQRSGDAAKTLAFSEQVLKRYPDNVDTRAERIKVFLRLNQDAKAKAEVDAILARSPGEPLGRFYQAVLVSRTKDKDRALLLMQGLPRDFAKAHPDLAIQMAQIALDSGKSEIAAEVLGSALAAAPDMLDLRLRFAQLRMEQDSPQGALVVLEPVRNSTDLRVQQLLQRVNKSIARNRSF